MQSIDYPPIIGNENFRHTDFKDRLLKYAEQSVFYKGLIR